MPNLFISKELSGWLKERGWKPSPVQKGDWYTYEDRRGVWLMDSDLRASALGNKATKLTSWYEILVIYAKEFWGEREEVATNTSEPWKGSICLHCGVNRDFQPAFESGCNHAHYPEACKICWAKQESWRDHTPSLLRLLQEDKFQEAEDYVRKHSLFAKQKTK